VLQIDLVFSIQSINGSNGSHKAALRAFLKVVQVLFNMLQGRGTDDDSVPVFPLEKAAVGDPPESNLGQCQVVLLGYSLDLGHCVEIRLLPVSAIVQ